MARCVLVKVDTEAISLTGGSQLVVTPPRLRTYRTLFTLQKVKTSHIQIISQFTKQTR